MASPDEAEENAGTEIDNIIPSHGYQLLPMVGLGASAGGIQALRDFLGAMPSDSGFAFVVVMHLSPEHESTLAPLLQRHTQMKVTSAVDGQRAEANCVYVIPPGKHLTAVDSRLQLSDLQPRVGKRVAVDLFLRSLADTHGAHAAAIILSGSDSDGAIGIKRIKERGGLTIAQVPEQAEHDGMVRSAIATGMVDWVLPVKEMPGRILQYFALERRLKMPPEEAPFPPAPAQPGQLTPAESETALRDVIGFVRSRTGRDFSYYKRATILRRISRRMQVNGIDDLIAYLAFLRAHHGEAGALLGDLLISVTNFFRDREAFQALEARIPDFVNNLGPGASIRMWIPACATGEEAYSLAILFSEYARTLAEPPRIQIFATDLDEEAIQAGREGLYPDTIAADVSEERLESYFTKDFRGYRIQRKIRDMVLFAVHDLLRDPPFSRLDLVSCRNLLIYLNRSAQSRALELCQFVLRPGGMLFLGASESLDESNALFTVLDKKHRIYAPKPVLRSSLPVLTEPSTLGRRLDSHPPPAAPLPTPVAAGPGVPYPNTWGEMHFKLLERLGPPSILVNREHEIVHLSENAGRFLRFAGGELSRNVLQAIHPMLRVELRAALFRATQSSTPVEVPGLVADVEGTQHGINLRVCPVPDIAPDLLLVQLDMSGLPVAPVAPAERPPGADSATRHLERELEGMKHHLRDVIEQHEASTEELKASNEELQAMNEELRSATEELETSREELQSINEELTTVNQELKGKVEELAHTNGDLHNLMGATAIATIFLDRDLRITRYTPTAVGLFNLIPTDLGRPLTDLNHRLDYPGMAADAHLVLQHLAPIESEVGEMTGRWFLTKILPYRSIEDRISGVVLTFVDITDRKEAETKLQRLHDELEVRVRSRTAELDTANKSLRAEIAQRQRGEQARRVMARHLMSAQEEERSRISRGLHDEVGQQLTALLLGLKALDPRRNPDKAAEVLPDLEALTEQIGHSIHEMALDLRPTALDDLGLVRAISNFAEESARTSGVALAFHASGFEAGRLPGPIETTLYRIVQEALNNVLRHAGAKNVSLVLERSTDQASAILEDDGAGFDPSRLPATGKPGRLGLVGMRERASLLGGEVRFESAVGKGTTVFVRLPVPSDIDDTNA